ncbi:hypothetical protein B0T25DRAFT_120879 [Lasiosphaeria hispida]|uniref:Uncharacterized protein n=1 Tax=Lasiosphaeria hispida TaxID=260671 RepID=A0AAJ0MIA5_9PEZI|nr:hypothetical protein B0T25DRAFT_120879 [Lasiosphaeria hispida]
MSDGIYKTLITSPSYPTFPSSSPSSPSLSPSHSHPFKHSPYIHTMYAVLFFITANFFWLLYLAGLAGAAPLNTTLLNATSTSVVMANLVNPTNNTSPSPVPTDTPQPHLTPLGIAFVAVGAIIFAVASGMCVCCFASCGPSLPARRRWTNTPPPAYAPAGHQEGVELRDFAERKE